MFDLYEDLQEQDKKPKKYKIPSHEYSEHLGDQLCYYFSQKNLEKGLYYNNAFFDPKNYVYRMHTLYSMNNPNVTFEDVYKRFSKYRKYYKKLWRGEDLTGKTIFMFKYICGSGDCIIFSRYIRLLEKMAKKVIIEVSGDFVDFFKYNFPDCEIVLESFEAQDIEYDYTCHLEHCLNMQKDLETFPYPEGYLKAEPRLIEKYAPIFNTNKFKVGIFHEGKLDDDDRCIRITKMFPIFENDQCQFYALNSDKSKAYAKEVHGWFNIIELQPYIMNVNDTAALMEHMDLIVTTDSFPPNLAGALGKKTYMLLHDKPGWRWFDEFYKTAWYDSVRIVRRTPYMTLEDQVEEMARLLQLECIDFYSKRNSHNSIKTENIIKC